MPVVDTPAIPQERAEMRQAILEEEVAELPAAIAAGDTVATVARRYNTSRQTVMRIRTK